MKIAKNDTILILSHFYKRAQAGGGPPQDLRDYLVPKVRQLIYIEHPFPYADDRRSSLSLYRDGKLEKTYYTLPLRGPEWLFYLHSIVATWYFLLRARPKGTICIALDNLNTFSVLPWRWVGLIQKLIFYTIDYTPIRFKNRLLNKLYHWIDRLAAYGADTIWVLSPRMVEARTQNGVDPSRAARSVVLPMGAKLDRIKVLPTDKINRHQLIFVGHLLEKQGLQLVIEALPAIYAKVPDLKLVVIGQGEYEKTLKQLAKDRAVDHLIDFKGFVKRHEDVETLLCQSAIGLAPYLPDPASYTYYTDPGKPKLYLGCGLPVIITTVPASAETIVKEEAGLIVEPSPRSIAEAIVKLLTDQTLYGRYRTNAIRLSREYNTDTLIARAIAQT